MSLAKSTIVDSEFSLNWWAQSICCFWEITLILETVLHFNCAGRGVLASGGCYGSMPPPAPRESRGSQAPQYIPTQVSLTLILIALTIY